MGHARGGYYGFYAHASMTIGVILHPYGENKPAGLARGILEFTRGMIANDAQNDYIIFVKKIPRVMPDFPGHRWRLEVLGTGWLWLTRLKNKSPADVYLFNTPVVPFFWKPKRAIVLAWDYGYLAFPPVNACVYALRDALKKRIVFWYHGRSLRRADHIIAVSEATRRETMRLFGIPAEKISVVYCGYKKVCDAAETPIPLPEKFFLFIGVVKERKNVMNIVRAFALFYKKHHDHTLVIGGNATGECADAVRAYISKEGLGNAVRFIGHLNDGQLSYIYRRAEALVFPSFVEGFGYPVLEGMDCGIPVITSNISSLAEIGGPAALLVDPPSPPAIAEAMMRIADEPMLRDTLIKKGVQWKQNFSWDKAGRELIVLCAAQKN